VQCVSLVVRGWGFYLQEYDGYGDPPVPGDGYVQVPGGDDSLVARIRFVTCGGAGESFADVRMLLRRGGLVKFHFEGIWVCIMKMNFVSIIVGKAGVPVGQSRFGWDGTYQGQLQPMDVYAYTWKRIFRMEGMSAKKEILRWFDEARAGRRAAMPRS